MCRKSSCIYTSGGIIGLKGITSSILLECQVLFQSGWTRLHFYRLNIQAPLTHQYSSGFLTYANLTDQKIIIALFYAFP